MACGGERTQPGKQRLGGHSQSRTRPQPGLGTSPHISKGSWVPSCKDQTAHEVLFSLHGLWKPKQALIKVVKPIGPGLIGLSRSVHSTGWTPTFFCSQWLPCTCSNAIGHLWYICLYIHTYVLSEVKPWSYTRLPECHNKSYILFV